MAKIFSLFCFLVLSLFAVSQTVDFTFQSNTGSFCNSSIIQFTQNSTGNPIGFSWNLGNGLKSTKPNPSTSYAYPGQYVVKLIATYPQGSIETSKTIMISPDIVPKISADRSYICQPGVINFTTAANGKITSYDWDFGDTTGISTTQPNVNSHTYSNYGSHSVIVKATDASGCFGYDSITIDVKKLPITATIVNPSGCIPISANYSAVVSVPLNSSVTNYVWDFGDGSAPSSTNSSSIAHLYTKVGVYSPSLNVTTSEGCTSTYDFPGVKYGTPPTNLIAYPDTTVLCGSDSATFIAKAINANNYLWNFGDGNGANAGDTIIRHKYKVLGTRNITVTPHFNGCANASTSFKIQVIGVIAQFTYANTCNDKKTFTFTNTTQGTSSSVLWNFGDGSPTQAIPTTAHTFPVSGTFTTLLTTADATTGCSDTVSAPIYTATPQLANADTAICINTNTSFDILNNYSNPAARYTWNVVGTNQFTSRNSAIKLKASALGNFNSYVVINNGNSARVQYCLDTVLLDHPISVRGPNLDFTVPPNLCFSDLVNITNNSSAYSSSDSVLLWYWNYGNSLSNDTIYQPPPVQYGAPGTYRIRLSGIDINGCRDSLRKSITVNPLPRLQVSPRIDTLCAGQMDTLFISHSDSILWTPSNGLSCTNCDTVLASPSVTTQYFITTTTSANCTIKDSVLINVIPNFTAIPTKVNQYICLNDRVTLDVGPKDKVVVWSPTTGLSNPNVYTPTARPRNTTTYTATLTDSAGCFTSTADMTVFIKSLPTVDAGIDRTLPYNSTFTISPTYSSNVRSYLWTPSGLLNCSTCAVPGGVAVSTESYQVQVTSDSGCIAKDSITIAIECKESNLLMPTAFSPNNDNLNDFYYPLARGIKTILRFSIYNREGQLLYEVRDFLPNNRSFAWNGEFKGARQSPRAYVYTLDALCDSGERISKSGSFLLLR